MNTPWVIAELRAIDSGNFVLATRRRLPSQYRARLLADRLAVEPDVAMVVGHSATQELHISVHANSTCLNFGSTGQLAKWLTWLRSLGVVRFAALSEESAPQVIPSLLVREALPFFSGLRRARQRLGSACPRISEAPQGSVLELVRRAGHLDRFIGQFRNSDAYAWVTLCTPLYTESPPMLGERDTWSFGALAEVGSGVWPQFARLRMTGIGRDRIPFIQDYPVDPLGLGWAYVLPTGPSAVDPGFQTPQDLDPLDLLDRVPSLLSSMLLEADFSQRTWDSSAECDRQHEVTQWASLITPLACEDVARLRQEFVDRIGSYGRCGYRPPAVRFLAAAPSEVVRERREQAFAVAPGMMPCVFGGRLPISAAAIDAAEPLIAALAADACVSRAVAHRTLQSLPKDARTAGLHFRDLAELLGDLGPHCPSPSIATAQGLIALRANLSNLSSSKTGVVSNRAINLLFRAVGRSAARVGWTQSFQCDWESICDLHGDAVQDLLVLAERSADVFLANCPEFDAVIDAPRVAEQWLALMDLEELSQAAIGWHFLKTGEVEQNGCARAEHQPYVPPLNSCSWVTNRMRLEIIGSRGRLLEEARIMQNCVSAYWRQICSYSLVLVSMVTEDQRRATLALTMTTSGQWRIQELKGPANGTLQEDSIFFQTAEAFCLWFADHPLHLDASVWETLTEARERHYRLLEAARKPSAAVQDFPPDLQHVPLGYLPGSGSLETRVRHAIRKVQKR